MLAARDQNRDRANRRLDEELAEYGWALRFARWPRDEEDEERFDGGWFIAERDRGTDRLFASTASQLLERARQASSRPKKDSPGGSSHAR